MVLGVEAIRVRRISKVLLGLGKEEVSKEWRETTVYVADRRARGGCGWFKAAVVSPRSAVFGSEAIYLTVVVHG